MFELLRSYPLLGRLMLGRFISGFSDQFLLFAVPLLVFQTTGSVAKSGASFFIEWLPRVISLPIAGSIVGRLGRTRTLILADGARAVILAVLSVVLFSTPESSWFLPLVIGSGLCSFLFAQSFIALESSFPQTIEKHDLHRGQALLQASEQGSTFLGPLAAGLISSLLAKQSLIPFAAVLFAFASLNTVALSRALTVLEPKARAPGTESQSWMAKAGEGFRIVGADVRLVAMVVIALSINLLLGSTMALNPSLVVGVFGVSDALFGLLNGFVGLLSILALILVPWATRHVSMRRLAYIALATIFVSGAALSIALNFPLHLISFGGVLAATMLFNVYMRTTRVRLVTASQLPGVIAAMVFMNQLTMPASGLIVSAFGQTQSPAEILSVVILVALSGLAGGVVLLFRSEQKYLGPLYVAR